MNEPPTPAPAPAPTRPAAPPPHAPPPSLSLGDILFVIFRHKWKILLLSLAAMGGAAALYLFGPVPYQSEAKLFVKYVVETKPPAQGTQGDAKYRTPGERGGESVINNEVEILTSLDLAQQVANTLAPDVLAKLGAATNVQLATTVIHKSLVPEVGKRTDVIHVLFKHSDPTVVQPILKQIIDTYLTKQADIHRAIGLYDDYLTKQRDELRSRLSATREELRKAKEKIGVISLDESKKVISEQISKIQAAILEADAQLAERQAEVRAMGGLLPTNAAPQPSLVATSAPSPATNLVAATNHPAPVASEKTSEYKRLCGLLEVLGKRDQELRAQFTPESRMVKGLQEQIVQAEKTKKQLEDENPGLQAAQAEGARSLFPAAASAGPHDLGPRMELLTQAARVPALESRIRVLTNQLDRLRQESVKMSDAEGAISELELTRQVQEAQYSYFQKASDELRADEQLGAVRNSNIIPIQTPSPPFRDSTKLQKMAAMVLFGGLAGAFALAFLIEFYLDPSLKRPIEVERQLHLPLFLSIPMLRLNGKAHRRAPPPPGDRGPRSEVGGRRPEVGPRNSDLGSQTSDLGSQLPAPPPSALRPPVSDLCPPPSALGSPTSDLRPRTSALVPLWDSRHSLRPFHDALRDRLITYFDLKKLTHKPKLVAVTSCGDRAGVSTIATGLAASLSETGEGNVLLVNMHEEGSAHQFYRGNLACGLEDALQLEKRDTALIQDNLYVVRETQGSDELPRSLPKQFRHLVPRLRASDYDYIIFDMPPISQISVSSKLARFMDITLVVVEAEETNREVVKRASQYLTQTGATVGVVLNKTRAYGPRGLLHEF